MSTFSWTLPLAAATVGALHILAPDHWMPFAALAIAVRTTVVCGLGHVTVSAILAIAALSVGCRAGGGQAFESESGVQKREAAAAVTATDL